MNLKEAVILYRCALHSSYSSYLVAVCYYCWNDFVLMSLARFWNKCHVIDYKVKRYNNGEVRSWMKLSQSYLNYGTTGLVPVFHFLRPTLLMRHERACEILHFSSVCVRYKSVKWIKPFSNFVENARTTKRRILPFPNFFQFVVLWSCISWSLWQPVLTPHWKESNWAVNQVFAVLANNS